MFKRCMRKLVIIILAIICATVLIQLTYIAIAKYNNMQYRYTRVFCVVPVLIIRDTTENILLKQYEGYVSVASSFSTIVVLSNNNWYSEELLLHELEHVKQNLKGIFIIHTMLYHYNADYRLGAEYAAYRAEGANRLGEEEIMDNLYNFYGLDMGKSLILNKIKNN